MDSSIAPIEPQLKINRYTAFKVPKNKELKGSKCYLLIDIVKSMKSGMNISSVLLDSSTNIP